MASTDDAHRPKSNEGDIMPRKQYMGKHHEKYTHHNRHYKLILISIHNKTIPPLERPCQLPGVNAFIHVLNLYQYNFPTFSAGCGGDLSFSVRGGGGLMREKSEEKRTLVRCMR